MKYLTYLNSKRIETATPSYVQSLQSLESNQLPTRRHEEWLYFNVEQVLNADYAKRISSSIELDDSFSSNVDCYSYTIRNGELIQNQLETEEQNSVEVQNIDSSTYQSSFDDFKAISETFSDDIVHQTIALGCDSLTKVRIKENQNTKKPVYINFIHDSSNSIQSISQHRLRFILEAGSKTEVIIRVRSLEGNPSLFTSLIEIIAEENSSGEFTLLQDDTATASQINYLSAVQSKGSTVQFNTITLSGGNIRNNQATILRESGATANMYGAYLINGNSLVDNHTVMDHEAPHCLSNELYKGIADGESCAVFNGKIFVRKDAQKTLAYQSNKNVILSEKASVNTKPQLEILADDVKCSHGCTVGMLDEESIFYLRSRGIPEDKAKALLLTAFVEDVTSKVSNVQVRKYINDKIEQTLNL